MVKTGKKAVTLAIGDGANDVGMIKGCFAVKELSNLYTVQGVQGQVLIVIAIYCNELVS